MTSGLDPVAQVRDAVRCRDELGGVELQRLAARGPAPTWCSGVDGMHPLGVEREETPERDGRRAGRARHQALPKTPDPRIDPKSPHSAAAARAHPRTRGSALWR